MAPSQYFYVVFDGSHGFVMSVFTSSLDPWIVRSRFGFWSSKHASLVSGFSFVVSLLGLFGTFQLVHKNENPARQSVFHRAKNPFKIP
jgi:TctA family transporter